MDDLVAIVGIVGMIIFGIVAVLKGLKTRIRVGPGGVEGNAE